MEFTTRQAADHLGVSQGRVRALVNAGNLEARRVGSQWLIDAHSLEQQDSLISAGAAGRPMAQRVAWAAADLADGGRASWLGPSERTRLRHRLTRAEGTEVFQRWLRRRADRTTRFRTGREDLASVLATPGVVRTGVSAVVAYRLGVGAGDAGDAYVGADLLERLADEHFLVETPAGNLTLRVTEHDLHLATAREIDGLAVAPRLMVGVDLADDPDPRTRSAGTGLLRSAQDHRHPGVTR